VRVKGNIAPLIELGAGFDSDMSVMDNIILYGVMLGFGEQEMRRRIPEILEFAELEDYISVPVKALSSGMVARLGFAIATDVQPDILILDEVLSVGDESFKNKSKQRIEKFWQAHATILLVSHDLNFLRKSCERVIWLERGRVKQIGDAEEIIQAYLESVVILDPLEKALAAPQELDIDEEISYPSREALLPPPTHPSAVIITRVFITNQDKQITASVCFESPFHIGIEYTVETAINNLRIGLYVTNQAGVVILEPSSNNFLPVTGKITALGQHTLYVKVPAPLLVPATYFLAGVGAYEEGFGHHYGFFNRFLTFEVTPPPKSSQLSFGQELVHPKIEGIIE